METQSYMARYYLSHKEELSAKSKLRTCILNSKVFALLGNSCFDCGENDEEFLTIDHIFSDRKNERSYSSHTWKRDLLNNIVDRSRYQVLCRNCNEAKQRKNPFNLMKDRIETRVMKNCSVCKIEKDICEFSPSSYRGKKCLDSQCFSCVRYSNFSLSVRCYLLLGGKCICCKENDPYKLNVDHIKNDGAQRRAAGELTGVGLYRQILSGKKPVNDYQLLCANCNYSKLRNGVCIHRELS